MHPVRFAQFLLAVPRLRAAASLQRVQEMVAASPYVKEESRQRIIRGWEREAAGNATPVAKPSPPAGSILEEHRKQLASLGIIVKTDNDGR